MKILEVIPYFAKKHGGEVNVCLNISKKLAEKHKVTIITTDFEIDNNYQNITNVEIITFPYFINLNFFLISPLMKKWLSQHIKEFDIVHLHAFRSFQNVIVYHYARKHKIPYIIQAHGSLPLLQKHFLKKIFDKLWGEQILKNAEKVIALNETEAGKYRKLGVKKDRIEIIPNGIDLKEYEKLPTKGKFREKYNIKPEEKIILYLGRLHKTKGIGLLLNAYSELQKELEQTKLVIVGPDDGFLTELKNLSKNLKISDTTIFTGPLYEKEKLEAYIDADVFVTPKFSGLPITFLESMACGTPIITTTKGDQLDWIDKNVGYVVEYDKTELKKAITKIINNKKLKTKYHKKGQNLIKTKYNWETISAIVKETYLKSLTGNK